MLQLTFGLLDYFVFTTLLGVSILMGIYFGFFSKQDTVNEYLYAGKSLSYIPVAISGISSLLSGITYLGFTTEVYLYGSQYLMEILGVIIAISIANYIILPVFFKLQLLCITEYLELRFSKAVRKFCSVTYVICLIAYGAIIIYAPAIAFSHLTGIELHLVTVIICTICIFYTSLGGVKAVVWTDTFQFIFTFGGFVSLLIIGTLTAGGFSKILSTSEMGGRIILFDMNPSLYARCSFWAVVSNAAVSNVSFACSQKHVQKLLAIHEESEARKAVWAILVGSYVIKMMCLIMGLAMYTMYHGCDPMKIEKIDQVDQMLPYFVMDIAGTIPGLPGLFLAGLISSGLATLSAVLNTLGSMFYDDFLRPWLPESYQTETKAACIMKVITVLVGAMSIGLVFVAEHLGTVFEISSTFSGVMAGPSLGLFVLGMLLPWVGKRGALIGSYVSLFAMMWLVWGTKWHVWRGSIRYEPLPTSTDACDANATSTLKAQPRLPPAGDEPLAIYNISMLYYTALGALITIMSGVITSYFANEMDTSNVNPDHISPIMRKFLRKHDYAKVKLKIVSSSESKPDIEDSKAVIINGQSTTNQQVQVVDTIKKVNSGAT